MNKPYFTKWIPVEGDIRGRKDVPVFNGEKVIFMQLDTSEKMLAFTELHGYKENIYKPCKLFLCSRDIMVGDKIIQNGGTEWNGAIFKRLPRVNDKGHQLEPYDMVVGYDNHEDDYHLKAFWFKIIGEVSPQAIWVKEGMEFDENEIHRCFVPDKGDPMVRQVQVKCPTCGTFH